MQYYKWMFENDKQVKRIPGFVFTSLDHALLYIKEFEDWCYNNEQQRKNLFTFNGIKPTIIKQFLTSHFGYREPAHKIPNLTTTQIKQAQQYFENKPYDYFTTKNGTNDIPLMLAIASYYGCIKYNNNEHNDVSDIEALYLWPEIMKKINYPDLIATQIP